jgi:DNA-binding transcriptional LysR family regulator
VGAVRAVPSGGLHFNNYPLLLQAAVNSQSIALGWGHLVEDLLARGSLVQCLPTKLLLEPAWNRSIHTPLDESAALTCARDKAEDGT